jgi:Phosphate-induced protein 1 conserved region
MHAAELWSQLCRYGWVGDTSGGFVNYSLPGRANCMSCLLLSSASAPPSGDAQVDGMLSHLAHEIAETATDPWVGGPTPDGSGSGVSNWIDSQGNEVGDICNWVMGSHQYDAAGHVRHVVCHFQLMT